MHTVPVPAATRLARVGSESTLPAARRVEPNATSFEVDSFSSVRARWKNSMSFGLAPGQPPSIHMRPRRSSCSAMRSLSSTVTEMPSSWHPSRSVVSKTSTLSVVMVVSCRAASGEKSRAAPEGRLELRTRETACASE